MKGLPDGLVDVVAAVVPPYGVGAELGVVALLI